MPRREKLSAVDTAWLRMDRPGNAMVICGVLLFADRVTLDRLRAVLDARFLRFPRFLHTPVSDAAGAHWVDLPFDIRRHVRATRLRAPGDARGLEALVSRLAGTPLPEDRPRWTFDLVERYGDGSALVVRIHHCYADGIALIQVLLSMMDGAPHGAPAFAAPDTRDTRDDADAAGETAAPDIARSVGDALAAVTKLGRTLVDRGAALWKEPARAVALAQQGGALTAEIARLAMMRADGPTRFKGTPGGKKRVAWAAPIPLDEVKAIGRALQASVNDVLLACVAGALRDYLAAKGDPVDGVTFRTLVPVNLRPAHRVRELGNAFGLVFLDLPIGMANPVQRLHAVRASMNALKGSLQPVLALGLLAAMGAGPASLQEALLTTLARNASAVMTNVPGPQQPLYLAGGRLASLMFWVPQSGDIGLGASILSYDGRVQFALIADRALCPDPARIVEGFHRAFEQLVLVTLLAPWPWEGDLDPAVAEEVARLAVTTPPDVANRHARRRRAPDASSQGQAG